MLLAFGVAALLVTLNGNVEQWTYTGASNGKLGRGTAIRTDENHFTFTAANPDFKEVCERVT